MDPQRCARKRPRGAAGGRAASLATRCTGELLRGGDGGPGCWVAARRNRCWAARGVSDISMLLRPRSSRGNRNAAYCSAEPDESHKTGVLGMLGAPRVRRLSTSPSAEEQLPGDSYKRPVLPPGDGDEELSIARSYCASRRGREGGRHMVSSTHHTPRLFVGCAIQFIAKLTPLPRQSFGFAARAS